MHELWKYMIHRQHSDS